SDLRPKALPHLQLDAVVPRALGIHVPDEARSGCREVDPLDRIVELLAEDAEAYDFAPGGVPLPAEVGVADESAVEVGVADHVVAPQHFAVLDLGQLTVLRPRQGL